MSTFGDKSDDEYSVIGDKGEIGFIDFEDDNSVCSYEPYGEGPVIISIPFPFKDGKPRSVIVGETAVDSITITNTMDEPVDLWTKIYASTPENSFTLSLMKPPSDPNNGEGFLEYFDLEDRMIQPGENLTIWLSCKPKEIGLHTSVVHFDAGDRIERVVFLLAEDKVSQSLSSRKPYSRGGRKQHFVVDNYVSGRRPTRPAGNIGKNRLPRYDIPQDIRELIESKQIPDVIKEGLTRENYARYFKALLIMEEIQLEEDMKLHSMKNVTMKTRGQFLSLVVPGLAEKRPSLVHGDFIFVKFASEAQRDDTAPYQGFIHRVEADEVYLKFAQDFHLNHQDENHYNVQFSYNRVNMRRLYQAIDAAKKLDTEFLFPSEFEMRKIEFAPFVNISWKLNEEQTCAIEMILQCKGAPPYMIYGPPGTGKTNTVVEAILQLYKNRESARILVCAPSNSAADHILEKILGEPDIDVRENEIFRLNAPSRSYEEVNPEHICYCFFDERIFKCPPLNALLRYRIIISTYMSASLLYTEGVKRGHFSHIFLDEAGQASEPETMVPLSNLCKRDTVVVLAGDPMQLGPVIYSKVADANGLGKSYLERLFDRGPYYACNESYITRLLRSYRSHREILYLPSKLFYNGELFSCKEGTSKFMASVDILPNREFPVLFLGIQGCDEREGNNPSWFNRIEISKVVGVIKQLLGNGNLKEEDIGVITPYRQQVLKLKKALEDWDMPHIKVGSVEQFQGQEKEVIIISTVRSTVKHNEFDKKHCLGFLSNSRRFNVAITRAISLLILIGNPHIISKDPYWHKLLWRCSDNNSYEGCPLPERMEFVDEDPYKENPSDHGGETFQPNDQDEWSQEPFQPEWKQEPSQTEWNQEPFQPEWGQNSAKDEDQWSDGWR